MTIPGSQGWVSVRAEAQRTRVHPFLLSLTLSSRQPPHALGRLPPSCPACTHLHAGAGRSRRRRGRRSARGGRRPGRGHPRARPPWERSHCARLRASGPCKGRLPAGRGPVRVEVGGGCTGRCACVGAGGGRGYGWWRAAPRRHGGGSGWRSADEVEDVACRPIREQCAGVGWDGWPPLVLDGGAQVRSVV